MTSSGLSIELQCVPRLCYAMQQSAVPWLTAVRLQNGGGETLQDLVATIAMEPPLAAPLRLPIAAVPPGETVELKRLDPRLDLQALANLVERVGAELSVTVRRGEEVLASASQAIEVLAYNEWPGLLPLPGLLCAFVSPNHPALPGVLHAVLDRLQQRTGNGQLDGYQSKDPQRAIAMLQAVHEALAAHGITYVNAPPSFERIGQKVRTPEQVLGDRLGTCLDLALLFAAILEHIGLHALIVMQRGHAFVGVWTHDGSTAELVAGSAIELRKRCDLGVLAVVECTACCVSSAAPTSFAAAQRSARALLAADDAVHAAIDVGAARRAGIRPLPPRTQAFAAVDSAPPRIHASGPPVGEPEPQPESPPEAPPRAPEPPKDRLEHWKGKLLDLTMFNRLLNFAETKKTLRLCAHELTALEDRLQQGGKLRIHTRPDVGQGGDPRDLAMNEQRTGVDVLAEFLSEELRAGRLRAEHEPDDLDDRLVNIYRHARTSLEESGANTLYLAVGFLRWFESPQSDRPRRAPLLLLPLVIERTSIQEGFRLVLDDAEPQINQTLLQMLRRDFEIEVGLGDTPPEDEHGVDVAAVLDAFRTAALSMARWEVETRAHVGFFSFTKYLMWLDLAARDDLLQSPVLRHLVETPGATFLQDVPEVARDELDDLDAGEVFCPKDADSSQLAAVLAGAAGRTFVLEGPPGTGKSQTITNLIAQALANDKRVLFVAEKRAALEVVQRRLDSVGLGAFCLELHSSKSGPKAVLEQLRRPLELGNKREPREWQELAADLQQQRRLLNHYVNAMHRRREHGLSVFAAIAQLVQLREARRVPMPDLLRRAPADVAVARRGVEELAGAARALLVPAEEVWWGVERTDWSPALLRDVAPVGQRLQKAAVSMAGALAAVSAGFGLASVFGEAGPSRDQVGKVLELAALFRAPSLPPAALLRVADWAGTDAALAFVSATGQKRDALWAPLAARWRRELLAIDLDRLAEVYRRSADAFFLVRWFCLRGPCRELRAFAEPRAKLAAKAVLADLERALLVRAEERRLGEAPLVQQLLGAAWQQGLADWAKIEASAAWVRDARRLLVQIVPGSLRPEPALIEALAVQLEGLAHGATVLPPQLGALSAANDELTAALAAATSLLDLDTDAAFGEPAVPGHCRAVEQRTQRWLADVPRLREHCAYSRAAKNAVDHGAEPLVVAHAHGELQTAELGPAFQRTFLEAWLDTVHAAEPKLAMFRGRDHERAIERFAELDRRAITVAAQVVVARLAARLPRLRDTQVASSELGLLERELKKQRRHKPVRRLLAEIPGLLARLAPCVLMSPLSVAQFLSRSGQRFDLVVFDEASQIPMWDAVGAIGRGQSLVVVGDSRQLPPTSFFQRIDQGDDIGEDDIPEDLESVLDECGAAGLPRMHLDWHYRSRHESLIAFSNHHYYQNRLLTFPAPEQSVQGLGVSFVPVRGIYDRGASQQNLIEAEALVAEVLSRLRDPVRNEQSLGIVTFSRAQQVLIEDLLDHARREHPDIEPFFTTVEEAVFVKNLENVQGDERDTILFSVCYGPDAAGKIYENYGPLNQQGGERRLNVAVTRARRELVVFSSLRADQVASRTTAIGARHLRAFLDYAERGAQALVAAVLADPSGDVESPFEAAVRDALVARGHEVHAQIGCSGYRIDLCVVDPDAPGRYLIGIECDGATYHSAATARDRDRLRAAVLRGLGWRLERIWSMDFWQDAAGQIARIEMAIAEAKQAVDARPLPEPIAADPKLGLAAVAVVAEPPPDPAGPRPFTPANVPAGGKADSFHDDTSASLIRAQIEHLLAAESPIVFDRVAKAVATAWDISRVTERVRERVRELLPTSAVDRGGALWSSQDAADDFVGFRVPADGAGDRSVEELPIVEVQNAMNWLLQQHLTLSAEDLAREGARCFGIARLGTVVRGVMEQAIDQLVERGLASRDGSAIRLP